MHSMDYAVKKQCIIQGPINYHKSIVTSNWNKNIYLYLEPICPLFLGFNPPKQGLFKSKQWSLGLQVYIYNSCLKANLRFNT